jgi:hypothetical protein
MGPTGTMSRVEADGPTCAVCERPVTEVLVAPSRWKVSASATIYAAVARCMLEPCGHTFSVRRGGLIH